MTGDTLQPDCPRTDAVLAIYLDGDVGDDSGFELVSGESLRSHLLDCDTCRRHLQRARRLDAVLAGHAGGVIDGDRVDALAERWFAAIAAEPAAEPVPSRGLQISLGALLVALPLAALAMWWLAAAAPAAAPDTVPPMHAAVAPPAPIQPAELPPNPPAATEILIADDAVLRRTQRPRSEPAPRAAAESELARTVADADASTDARLAAAARLAQGARGGQGTNQAFAVLLQTLASLGDRDPTHAPVHRRALDIVREAPSLLGQLVARLQHFDPRRGTGERDDLAALTVAARIGERSLDAALLRAVRRQPDLAPALAAALRCGVRESGTAVLLLDAWQDIAARGDLADHAAPLAWFADQPEPVFTQLGQELRSTRSAPRRVHCLLALGMGCDPASLELLLAQLERAPFLEAHAAAFALSLRPRYQLSSLAERARVDDQFLLRAALARARVPAAAGWVAALALGGPERELLDNGPFADFPRVAGWFRDRSLSVGN